MGTDTPAIFTWLHQETPLCAVRKAALQAESYVSHEHYDSGTAYRQETDFSAAFRAHTWTSPKHRDIYEKEVTFQRKRCCDVRSESNAYVLMQRKGRSVHTTHPFIHAPYEQKWWVYER